MTNTVALIDPSAWIIIRAKFPKYHETDRFKINSSSAGNCHRVKLLPLGETTAIEGTIATEWNYYLWEKLQPLSETTATEWNYCHWLKLLPPSETTATEWNYSHWVKLLPLSETTVTEWNYCHSVKLQPLSEATATQWNYCHSVKLLPKFSLHEARIELHKFLSEKYFYTKQINMVREIKETIYPLLEVDHTNLQLICYKLRQFWTFIKKHKKGVLHFQCHVKFVFTFRDENCFNYLSFYNFS